MNSGSDNIDAGISYSATEQIKAAALQMGCTPEQFAAAAKLVGHDPHVIAAYLLKHPPHPDNTPALKSAPGGAAV